MSYCIHCGVRLETGHRFCWSCGAARWEPEPDAGSEEVAGSGGPAEPAGLAPGERPPPIPGTQVFDRRPAAAPAVTQTGLGMLPWFYAAGAVFFLVEATRALAALLSPESRAQQLVELGREGVPSAMRAGLLTMTGVGVIAISLTAAVLHGAAFYGLRRLRRWGWISAVVVASLWSLLIVGIPVLLRLVNRSVRQTFGVD